MPPGSGAGVEPELPSDSFVTNAGERDILTAIPKNKEAGPWRHKFLRASSA